MKDSDRIWMCAVDSPSKNVLNQICADLEKKDLEIEEFDKLLERPGFGILILDKIETEFINFIKSASSHVKSCILVLLICKDPPLYKDVWRLIRAGASDVLTLTDLISVDHQIMDRFSRWQEIDKLINSDIVRESLVGKSLLWNNILRQIAEAARFTTEPILLTGETGTGKELAAHLIHTMDPVRRNKNLQIQDCTTIVPELSGSELFGHERGAFTGAIYAREGAFSLADKGTLFLDEVGELPVSLQVQLLRVMQEKTYKRVGSNEWCTTDFRLVCATNRDLYQEVLDGRFRRDLYYRIAGWTINLPPLRKRREDILPLVHHFIKLATGKEGYPQLDPRVEQYYLSRDYPGNVRDLKNLVFRMCARSADKTYFTIGDIPSLDHPDGVTKFVPKLEEKLIPLLRQALNEGKNWDAINKCVQCAAVHAAIEETGGGIKNVASILGRNVRTIHNWTNGSEISVK